ncbi:MAG: ComEC/Rec2 family competence protein [Puniceicoccales bacterium]|jgi:competence protein ComEC|nr:ComEC/Rec2 family competence protein [Puniceicoccales bacterium]
MKPTPEMPDFVIDEPLLDSPAVGCGHLPLLWVFLPLALIHTACFTGDWHLPGTGLALFALGGAGVLLLSWKYPKHTLAWACFHILAISGAALLLFAGRVPPLVDWVGLPPRETSLVLRWEQVFAIRASGKTINGLARVIEAPPFVPGLHGTLIHCQMRKPVPTVLGERGAVFAITGVLESMKNRLSNGYADDADFVNYLENRRVTLSLSRCRAVEVIHEPPSLLRWCARQRDYFEGVLERGLEEQHNIAPLYIGMLLGKSSGIDREMRNSFARTGTAHLFSVSGLHVGMIAAMLFQLGRFFRIADKPWRITVIALMFVFVMITSGAPAALRAWLMVSCILMARLINRRGSSAAGLALAATGTLLWAPELWLDISFQLSYGVVTALVFYGIPLSTWIGERWQPFADLPVTSRRWRHRLALRAKNWLVGSLCISTAATLASAPLVITHFKLFSAGSLLANLLVIPLAFPVMLLGVVSMAMGLCGLDALSMAANWLAGWDLQLLELLVRTASGLPGMAWELEYRAPWFGRVSVLLLLGSLLLLSLGKNSRGWHFFIPPGILALSLLLGTH